MINDAGLNAKNTPLSTSNDTTPNTNYITTLEQQGDDLIMNIPDELGWNVGDTIEFDYDDDTIIMRRV